MKVTAKLDIRNVTKTYGGTVALADLTLAIAEYPVTAIIGPNGAGKTTLLNLISGFARPDSGTLTFCGQSLGTLRPDQINALGIVRTFQIPRAFPSLSVLENLMTFAGGQSGEHIGHALLRTETSRRREREVIAKAFDIARRLRLLAVIEDAGAKLSGGQKKLLELGRALMSEPQLILLDEPVSGVNPSLVGEIASLVRNLASEGYRFLVIEHNMDFVQAISDHVIVLANGRYLANGSFAKIIENDEVQEAYLGGSRRHS